MTASKVKHPTNTGKRLQHVSAAHLKLQRLTLTFAEPPDLPWLPAQPCGNSIIQHEGQTIITPQWEN